MPDGSPDPNRPSYEELEAQNLILRIQLAETRLQLMDTVSVNIQSSYPIVQQELMALRKLLHERRTL